MSVFRKLKKRAGLRDDRGIAALEMAILLPALLLLLMGILEFGYAFYVNVTLTNAVREGARAGVVIDDDDDNIIIDAAENRVTEYVTVSLPAALSSVTVPKAELDNDAAGNTALEVMGTIPDYRQHSPFQILPDHLMPSKIVARATMRLEN